MHIYKANSDIKLLDCIWWQV